MTNLLDKIASQRTEKSAPRKGKRTDEVHCVHYWLIETPQGPTSMGKCKYCGTVKEFQNYIVYSPWEDEILNPRKRSRTKATEYEDESDILEAPKGKSRK